MGLVFIRGYLREYARITLASIKTPRKFFEEVKHEDNSKSLDYMFVSSAVFAAGLILGLIVSSYHSIFLEEIFILITVFVLSIIFTILVSTICSAVLHLALILVKGKGGFYQTFKVICYSASPINFAGLFIFVVLMTVFHQSSFTGILTAILLGLFICALYMFYIMVVGISVTSEISGNRAFAALMIQFFIFALIPTMLYSVPAYIHNYGEDTSPSYSPTPYPTPSPAPSPTPTYENYTPPNPEKYRITAYAGSPPQIDGAVTEEDKWYEGEQFIGKDSKRTYYITIKHDFEYTYILMEWEYPFKRSTMEVFFEQNADKQDFYLHNGRVDMYIQGDYRDENLTGSDSPRAIEAQIDGCSDLHFVGYGYAYDEHQDGSLKGGYVNGKWTLEWKIPLNSGDKDDIYIDKYPTEVGFAITNPLAAPEGVFPPDAENNHPRTWGTMTIVDKRRQ